MTERKRRQRRKLTCHLDLRFDKAYMMLSPEIWVIFLSNSSKGEGAVLAYLTSKVNYQHNVLYTSYAAIMEATGAHRKTVHSAIEILRDTRLQHSNAQFLFEDNRPKDSKLVFPKEWFSYDKSQHLVSYLNHARNERGDRPIKTRTAPPEGQKVVCLKQAKAERESRLGEFKEQYKKGRERRRGTLMKKADQA
jgi:hypothetical protein